MQKSNTLILGVLWLSQLLLTAASDAPLERMTPEDVVQDSIKIERISDIPLTNKLTVFFTYTEVGARKMLAFSEVHAGQKACKAVGDWLSPVGLIYAPQFPLDSDMFALTLRRALPPL
jgi:hypothetical protein